MKLTPMAPIKVSFIHLFQTVEAPFEAQGFKLFEPLELAKNIYILYIYIIF